ncbi:MAG: hypothetical protein Q7N50_07145 [Armatimonadota bacterium]|nr:hypothetical protein [Armatimonadota bacterium]
MSVTMRIIQQFDIRHESEFMDLEKKFAQLEARRPDYPKGRRMQPISATEPCNTLIWECEFPDIQSARDALNFFHGDEEHEELFEKQLPFFKSARIEFYDNLDF